MNEDSRYIDPKQYRLRNAFRQLTVVRIAVFIGHIIGRGLALVFELAFRIIKAVGLFVLDIFYGLKVKLVDLKYSGRRERLQLRSIFYLLVSLVLLVPRAIGSLLIRIGRLLREGAERSGRGLAEETKQAATKPTRRGVELSMGWSLVNFVLTLLVIVSPLIVYSHWRSLDSLKGRILASTEIAFNGLFSAKDLLEARDITAARTAFSDAGKNFLAAQADLFSINRFLFDIAAVVPSKSFRLAASSRHIVEAGKLSAELGEQLSGALQLPSGQAPTAGNFLENFVTVAKPAIPVAKKLECEMSKIDAEALPEQYREQFANFSSKSAFLAKSLEEAVSVAEQAEEFLGQKMDKRYLLVFQNNAEKRGAGGFIGSFATIDIRRGEIARLTVPTGGSYDTEAGLKRKITAPEPLHLLKPQWFFWDANWWPDWPTSARKLMWFYEKSDGPTVDGVISLTPTVLEKILAAIGPVDMTKEYGVVIDADNFWNVTQTFSEQKPDVTKEPKKIIGDLMNAIIAELPKRLTPEMTIKLVGALEDSLNEKQTLAYFTDKGLQSSVNRLGWGGEMSKTSSDYVMVADTNIGGQKSDRVIEEALDHNAEILPDGSIIDTLTIRRHHTGTPGQLFTGVRNVNWLRAYVPEGSVLISASGFNAPDPSLFKSADPSWELDPDLENERQAALDPVSGTKIYGEAGKTVFANWSMIDPGQTAVITLKYRLPFKVPLPTMPKSWPERLIAWLKSAPSPAYSLLVQKQPGAATIALRSHVSFQGHEIAWHYPEAAPDGAYPVSSDFFTAFLFK